MATTDQAQLAELLAALPSLAWAPDAIVHEDRRFFLRAPLRAQVAYQDGMWTHQADSLGLLGYGGTFEESVDSFNESFAFAWDTYAQEADQNLTEDARMLKGRLLELVAAVEPT